MKTIEITQPHELARLRRRALAAQGLLQAQPYGRGLAGARRAISHIGYVQIDTISVVERAHNHVFHSRVPGFTAGMTNQLLRNGDMFEYWTHAASFMPIADFRFSLPYKHAIKNGQTLWYKNPDKKLMRELLARIRSEGPLRSRDLEANSEKRAGWWDWKPAKKALEQLYMQGDLMVSDREGFQKTYDLTERVLPTQVNTHVPTTDEFAAHIVDRQLRCHGLVSLKGLTYHQRKNPKMRNAVKALVDKRLAQGTLELLRIPSGEVFITKTGLIDGPLPRTSNRLVILSPFDNCVIQRERLKALFHFDYQIECYLPEAKRRYGYFSLPLLYRDAFIGRMDCKAHRKTRHLEIKSLHIEAQDLDKDCFMAALADAIERFNRFQDCDTVSLSEVRPKKWKAGWSKALKPLG